MPGKSVSVIIPTKNSEKTIGRCIDSVLAQTHKNIEIIVVDNHSTDSTPTIAKKYELKFYTKGPERCPQRNFGAAKASGEYLLVIDSDMVLSPKVIEDCCKLSKNNSRVTGVVVPEESFGSGFWARCKKLERSFYLGVPYIEAARFFKKSIFEKVGGYDESLVSGEDWDLSQRIEQLGKIDRSKSFIYHDEGHISLLKTVKKKYYYAQKFAAYQKKNKGAKQVAKQTGILERYWLFLSKPKKLFKNPVIGFGMLFMKTCEFTFGGLGYIKIKILG
jgi:glycosyltransferase involved in cell wall biosynthesis